MQSCKDEKLLILYLHPSVPDIHSSIPWINRVFYYILQRTKYIYHLAICILWGDRVAKKSKKKNVILFSLPFRMNIMNHNRSIFYDFACSVPGRKCDQTGPWCPSYPRPRAPSAMRAAAASHGTNGGDVKALLRRGLRALAILQTRQ